MRHPRAGRDGPCGGVLGPARAAERASMDTVTLILAAVFSLIGMAALAYGRRSSRIGVAIGGVVLMFFPYFTPNPLTMLLIGAAIVAGMYLFPG